ncbi:Sec1-like protein [Pseudovirgaria hyperparasitica]|uniref:Sec1-like protein n=1 Tax=Pseudovirgaria hyperparasitica TaxID=470096 RepID=A0A6A6VW28_9PEZI|nr:Sec1-like protein [Pseudovirgaria hyperparasitica]KAF2754443.1 Sec1-like protein [Pseudovirgaria hyperparasitica]
MSQWKVLVLDPTSKKLVYNAVREDDILNLQITNIELIDEKRPMNKDMDAIYILTPESWIVDCMMADFERHRYRSAHLIWTSLPPPALRERIDRSSTAREQIRVFKVLDADYFPRESHLVTFRDPWSFPILFHPACNNLVREHLEKAASQIVAVCVSLGEYPTIRYYRPRTASHEAGVLCTHLARMVQEQIDMYAQYHPDFPPQSNRPRGALFITDRSMDLVAPFLHEFTYQAMAHDLLQIKDGDKVSYKTLINEGQRDEQEKEHDIVESDRIWVENRHRHMKDTIEKLMGDFQKFMDENPQFTNKDGGNATSLNAIKDMLAGLPEFQSMKEAYSLHLSMAQECMSLFQKQKLPDLASVEQSLATGLDEDYRKPKNLADQVVRTLDEESIKHPDRLRLIALYLLYKDGLLPADLMKLLAHAQLPPQDGEVLHSLELLGARVSRPLKDTKSAPIPLFPRKPNGANNPNQEEYALSRFTPALKYLLEDHVRGGLDQLTFPFTKPQVDAAETAALAQESAQAASSLRSAKPTWAKSRLSSVEPRQRIIVFVAGGATYSESRACYEVSRATSRDVFLVTSHMLTPGLFMRQLGDLGVDKRRLGIPAEQPKRKAPAHLFEPEAQAKPIVSAGAQRPGGLPSGPAPPTAAMGKISLSAGAPQGRSAANGTPSAALAAAQQASSGKISGKEKDPDKKKRHHFFGSRK